MTTGNGKIARLAQIIRDKLNRRLDNREPTAITFEWLNVHPETQPVLNAEFGGRHINQQNLGNWCQSLLPGTKPDQSNPPVSGAGSSLNQAKSNRIKVDQGESSQNELPYLADGHHCLHRAAWFGQLRFGLLISTGFYDFGK
jgi:hypothetical protein